MAGWLAPRVACGGGVPSVVESWEVAHCGGMEPRLR